MIRSWLRPFVCTSVVAFAIAACGGAQPEPAATSGAVSASSGGASGGAVAPAAGVGQLCGTRGVQACPANLYCDYAPADQCGATDKPGHCAVKAEACTADFDPVCGCDGKTYSNACGASTAGVGVKKKGAC